jgi:transposase
MQLDYLTRLLGIQGHHVTAFDLGCRKERIAVIVTIARDHESHTCPKCGVIGIGGYDSKEFEVRHLMFWSTPTFIRFERYRGNCKACGILSEPLNFVDVRGPRVTAELAHVTKELCKVTTVKAVGDILMLHRHTVKAIDKQALQEEQANRPLDGITVLGMDELSHGKGKGHKYKHMISALEGPRGPELLFVGKGRKERNLSKFWKWFGKERARIITHAVMDMWKPFRNSVRKHCPSAQIIYDKFHVIQHLLKALNAVRVQEIRKAGKWMKGRLSGKKFILLSRQAHVRGNARAELNNALRANKRLFKSHLMKETFAHLWSYASKTWARKFFRGWVDQLKWSRLKPMHKFARMVEKHLDGILAYCDNKVPLGFVEAANAKARNVIRRAYGYRDNAYLDLKIIQTCTPWMNRFKPWSFTHSRVP